MTSAVITLISYKQQLSISKVVITKHLEAKKNKILNEYFNSKTDGIILYTKSAR